ncbi:MAG: glycine cleavage system aminomethyltransferase GcvT [Phycisphaerales bacterium]
MPKGQSARAPQRRALSHHPRFAKDHAVLKTPLNAFHNEHGGKMVDFAGWQMPLTYSRSNPDGTTTGGTLDEHHQVRTSGGLFDVSHMGRVRFEGRHARKLLEKCCTRKIHDMKQGQCRYSLVCNEQGGIKDDVIVYREDEDRFLVVVNASNRAKLLEHFNTVVAANQYRVSIDDHTEKTAMVALQGPKVIPFISNFSREIPGMKRYTFTVKNLLVVKLTVSRTGYTGEDGVEVILPSMMVGMAMKLILKDIDVTKPDALIKPAGLGCRDTLRMEAGMPLYGHELLETTNALGAGVDFAVSLDKDQDQLGEAFIGIDALKKTRAEGGPARRLVGIALEGKRSARQGMQVQIAGKPAGEVTSGCPSPTLGYPIAMAYVDAASTTEGTTIAIDTGRGMLDGRIVKLPFYKAPKPATAPPATSTV